jgi:hypothetical protein
MDACADVFLSCRFVLNFNLVYLILILSKISTTCLANLKKAWRKTEKRWLAKHSGSCSKVTSSRKLFLLAIPRMEVKILETQSCHQHRCQVHYQLWYNFKATITKVNASMKYMFNCKENTNTDRIVVTTIAHAMMMSLVMLLACFITADIINPFIAWKK